MKERVDFQKYFDRIAYLREREMYKEAFHHIGPVLHWLKSNVGFQHELVIMQELLATLSSGVWTYFYSARHATEEFEFNFIIEMDELSSYYIKSGRDHAAFNLWRMLASKLSGSPRICALNRLMEFNLEGLDQGFYENLFYEYGEAFAEFESDEDNTMEDFKRYLNFASHKKLADHPKKFLEIIDSASDWGSENERNLIDYLRKNYEGDIGFELDMKYVSLCIKTGHINHASTILAQLISNRPEAIKEESLIFSLIENFIEESGQDGLQKIIETSLWSYDLEYKDITDVLNFISQIEKNNT